MESKIAETDPMAEKANPVTSNIAVTMVDDVKDYQSVEDSSDGVSSSVPLSDPEKSFPENDVSNSMDHNNDDLATKRMEDEEDLEQDTTPIPKYQARQRVWARDYQGGGLLYEAVVRRCLYGVNNQMQIQIGLLSTEQEAVALMEKEQQPGWHYFVHFLGWNGNWDRWVPEADVLEPTDDTKEYAALLQREHKALRQTLTKGKRKASMDGTIFMREWRKRMDEIHLQMNQERRAKERRDELVQQGSNVAVQDDNAESKDPPLLALDPTDTPTGDVATAEQTIMRERRWDKTTLERERKLREQNLTMDRQQVHAEKLILPMGLKKALVEEWEVILQCNMVANLPATVTVRQALDKYLESKLEQLGVHTSSPSVDAGDVTGVKEGEPMVIDGSVETGQATSKTTLRENVERGTDTDDEDLKKRKQEWVDMVEGVALFFDQALPVRLLYKQEFAQHRAIEADDELSKLRKSELYGCEHLLRLLVHLPAILANELEDAVAKPILGKVNDFVRFLHKNQGTLFLQSYRRLNEAEEQEQIKQQRNLDRKRKRVVSKQDVPPENMGNADCKKVDSCEQ
jgi:mortality factor 4-like protein 1